MMVDEIATRKDYWQTNDTEKEDKDIILSLHKIKKDLDAAYNAFDCTTDELLVDSLIYKIQYLQKKFEFYNKKAKEQTMRETEKIS